MQDEVNEHLGELVRCVTILEEGRADATAEWIENAQRAIVVADDAYQLALGRFHRARDADSRRPRYLREVRMHGQ